MKKICVSLVLLFFTSGLVFADDPAIGLWKLIDKKGSLKKDAPVNVYRFYEKDDKLLGKLLAAVCTPDDLALAKCKESYKYFPEKGKVNRMAYIGTPLIYNLENKSDGYWKGGRVINPSNGKWYYCKVTFHKADDKKYKEDTLQVRFEVGLGIGANIWMTRATEADIEKIHELTLEFKEKIPKDYPKATQ